MFLPELSEVCVKTAIRRCYFRFRLSFYPALVTRYSPNIVYLPCFLQFDVFFSSFPWPLPLPSSFVGGSSSRTQEQHLQSETHAALFPWQPLHWALLVQTIKQCQLCIHTHSCTHWRAPPHSHPFKGFPAGRLLFLIWAVFPKLLLLFFFLFTSTPAAWPASHFPHTS